MTTRTRLAWRSAVFLTAVVGAASWSVAKLNRTVDRTREAAADLAACLEYANRIDDLRERPDIAGLADLEIHDLTRLVEHAAAKADVATPQLERVWPQPTRRVGDSPYKVKPTQILLRNISLEATIRLLHGLGEADDKLWVSDLRLASPRNQEAASVWTVEATISYLIYAPQANERAAMTDATR